MADRGKPCTHCGAGWMVASLVRLGQKIVKVWYCNACGHAVTENA